MPDDGLNAIQRSEARLKVAEALEEAANAYSAVYGPLGLIGWMSGRSSRAVDDEHARRLDDLRNSGGQQ